MALLSEKEQFEIFKKELAELLKRHGVYLYAEDGYGAVILEILACKRGVFDSIVLAEEDI